MELCFSLGYLASFSLRKEGQLKSGGNLTCPKRIDLLTFQFPVFAPCSVLAVGLVFQGPLGKQFILLPFWADIISPRACQPPARSLLLGWLFCWLVGWLAS